MSQGGGIRALLRSWLWLTMAHRLTLRCFRSDEGPRESLPLQLAGACNESCFDIALRALSGLKGHAPQNGGIRRTSVLRQCPLLLRFTLLRKLQLPESATSKAGMKATYRSQSPLSTHTSLLLKSLRHASKAGRNQRRLALAQRAKSDHDHDDEAG